MPETFVAQLYRTILMREPDAAGLAFDSLCSSVIMPTAVRFSVDVTTFGLERP